jgi:hypothetical protein
MPGVEADLDLALESQRGKVTIAAAHVQGWGRQVEGLVEGRLHSADEGAEVGQVKQVEVEKILVVHAIMIAVSRKVIAGAFL